MCSTIFLANLHVWPGMTVLVGNASNIMSQYVTLYRLLKGQIMMCVDVLIKHLVPIFDVTECILPSFSQLRKVKLFHLFKALKFPLFKSSRSLSLSLNIARELSNTLHLHYHYIARLHYIYINVRLHYITMVFCNILYIFPRYFATSTV